MSTGALRRALRISAARRLADTGRLGVLRRPARAAGERLALDVAARHGVRAGRAAAAPRTWPRVVTLAPAAGPGTHLHFEPRIHLAVRVTAAPRPASGDAGPALVRVPPAAFVHAVLHDAAPSQAPGRRRALTERIMAHGRRVVVHVAPTVPPPRAPHAAPAVAHGASAFPEAAAEAAGPLRPPARRASRETRGAREPELSLPLPAAQAERLTDQVVRALDRRLRTHRERTGGA